MIRDKIKQIKYSRLSTEEKYLINVFDNMVEYKTKLYPDSIFYTLDGKIILEINPDTYIYILFEVWKGANKDKTIINDERMFSTYPGFQDTQQLIRIVINNYLGLDNYFPLVINGLRWKINNIVDNMENLRKD